MPKDYYKSLNVDKGASKDEIKKAFRKLAHEHHPDKTGGNDTKFKEINEAYSVLSDDSKRSQYDQFGSAGPGGFGGQGGGYSQGASGFEGFDFSGFGGFGGQSGQGVEFDLGDIFGGIFGGSRGGGRGGRRAQPKGRDIQVDLEISFKESIFGVDKEFSLHRQATCERCKGNRAEPGTPLETCKTCEGQGQVVETRRSMFGAFQSAKMCDGCAGTGKVPKEKCKECKGKGVLGKKDNLTVVIPAGIQAGESLRVVGKGEALAGGVPGDLFIRVHIRRPAGEKDGSHLTRDGYHLIMEKEIKLSDALLGAEIKIETLDGPLTVSIPQGITHGEILRVRNKGVPHGQGSESVATSTSHNTKRGDLLIKISVHIPKKLSKEAKKLAEELKREGN